MKNVRKTHTDTKYYSKEDLKMDPEFEFSKELWNEIVEYRNKFSFEIPLLFSKNKNVRLTQTPWILQKEIKMITSFSRIQQAMLTNISTKYSSSTLLEDIEHKSFVSDIHWMMNRGKKKNEISRTIIENIVVHGEDPTNAEEKEILSLYEKFVAITNKWTSPREIATIFYGFKKFENPLLNDIHASLVETVTSNKIYSLLTKVSSTMFAIMGNDMFGEKSYEIAVLSLLSLLGNSYKANIMKGIAFNPTFDYFRHDFYKAVQEGVKEKGDLTYLTQTTINVIMYSVRLSNERIETYIKNETRFNSLSTRDKNRSIDQLRHEHPNITKKQAEFYVAHNDPRASYTLNDFRKYIGSAYETSRYSLENLVKEGFYKKKLVGKKYVYKAVKK